MKLPLSSLKKIMKRNEIVGFIEDKFKKIARQFQKVIVNFEPEDIYQFRAVIKKLKVFFHLLSMESSVVSMGLLGAMLISGDAERRNSIM
jgi:hypothetical protein